MSLGTTSGPRVAALLAAGGGSRYTGADHKLLAVLRGRPLWEWALGHVLKAGFDAVVVVTGAVPLDPAPAVAAAQGTTTPGSTTPGTTAVHVVHNPAWSGGQASSVQLAVQTAASLGADAVTIGLADQPFVTARAWAAVAAAPADCRIVVATYDGRPGPNPVRLAADVWPLLPTAGDAGARGLIGEHPEWVCSVACVGSVADVDTLEDLARWNQC